MPPQHRILILTSFILLLSLSPDAATAEVRHNQEISKFKAQVSSCHDGDTCKAEVNGRTVKIRLAGIDAPEIEQPEGLEAKKFLESLILKKTVVFDCKGKSYDRIVCLLSLDGVNINEEMVRRGFAFDYQKYSNGKYKILMETAQNNKTGIWKTLRKSPFCTRHAKSKACLSNSFYNQ